MTELVADRERGELLAKTVGVIVFDGNGNVLCVRHESGSRQQEGAEGLPGGHKERDETDKQAAIRELEEETGLIVEEDALKEFPGNIFNARIGLNGDQEDASWTIFIATKTSGELRDESGTTSPEWVPIKRLNLVYETLPNVSIAVQNASNFINETH